MFSLAADYFLLVFFATLGLLQLVAAYSGLRGALIIPKTVPTYVLGGGALVGAFTWFVLTGDPSIPGDLGGVEGSEQFGLFLAGVAAAIAITALLASVAQPNSHVSRDPGSGIDGLRRGTVWALLRARLGGARRHG